MCGIYGAIGCELSEADAIRALRTLDHRGPDGFGHSYDERRDVFLGHTRLSIIDLSDSGRQPMSNEAGDLVLTFNGEIYNYQALRDELMARGHRFSSTCDAEVILPLYEECGMELLDRLHGMFAFALWDAKNETLHIARDRIGIKPLYYQHEGKKLAFASELKAIVATPGLSSEPDVSAYYDFLTYQHVPAPKTIRKHASKLPPGHRLEFRAGDVTLRQYWDVEFAPDESLSREEALDGLTSLLREVVRDHLVADVPVGSFLSGGLDSTIVTALASQENAGPLEAFTIRFPSGKTDEASIASDNAARLDLRHHVRDFDVPELLERLPRGNTMFDEPFADHSFLPTLAVSEMARETMKVVVSGDGGDETHLGYGRYFKAEKRRLQNNLVDAIPFAGALIRKTPLKRVQGLRTAVEGDLGRTCHYYGGIPRETKRLFLDLSPDFEDYDDYWVYRKHARDELSTFARQQYMDLKTSLPDGILTKVDRASMAVGLEVRPPLLDHRLVEFAAKLPDRFKHENGRGKALLASSLTERVAPQIGAGPKKGFSIPLKRFVVEEDMFRVREDFEVADGFRVRANAAQKLLDPRRDHQKLWILDSLRRFVEGTARA